MSFMCQICHSEKATVHITDTHPKKIERHLCEDCAEKEGVIHKQSHTTNEILKHFIKQKTGIGAADDTTCPKCGMTFRTFQLKGQLGCANDYEVFRSILKPLLERAHEGANSHVGKAPAGADPATREQAGLRQLKRELKDAVEHEDYEMAARVRDKISTMESK